LSIPCSLDFLPSSYFVRAIADFISIVAIVGLVRPCFQNFPTIFNRKKKFRISHLLNLFSVSRMIHKLSGKHLCLLCHDCTLSIIGCQEANTERILYSR
jgi:hypothetical protein